MKETVLVGDYPAASHCPDERLYICHGRLMRLKVGELPWLPICYTVLLSSIHLYGKQAPGGASVLFFARGKWPSQDLISSHYNDFTYTLLFTTQSKR